MAKKSTKQSQASAGSEKEQAKPDTDTKADAGTTPATPPTNAPAPKSDASEAGGGNATPPAAEEVLAARPMSAEEEADLRKVVRAMSEEDASAPGPSDMILTVVGPEKGFRRAGRAFSRAPTTIPGDEISWRQLLALQEEPELIVTISPREDAPDGV